HAAAVATAVKARVDILAQADREQQNLEAPLAEVLFWHMLHTELVNSQQDHALAQQVGLELSPPIPVPPTVSVPPPWMPGAEPEMIGAPPGGVWPTPPPPAPRPTRNGVTTVSATAVQERGTEVVPVG